MPSMRSIPRFSRPDGTVDHVVSERLLQRVDCEDIVSIHFVRDEQAVQTFGPGARRGAMVVAAAPSNASVRTGRR